MVRANAVSVAPKDQVSRAAKMLAEEYVCLIPLVLWHNAYISIGHCVEYQVSSQSAIRPICDYLHPAAVEAVQ